LTNPIRRGIISKEENMTPLELAISGFRQPSKKVQKNRVPYRIKYNGEFIETHSGKTVWPNISAAKNALRNHVYHSVGCEHKDQVYNELLTLVEFIPLSET
jgi:hypothetical protein